MLKELPQILYSELGEKIGDPKSYEENLKKDFFNDKVNISIPCAVAPETPKKEEKIDEEESSHKDKTLPNTEERKEAAQQKLITYDEYTPIKSLNTFLFDWKIKVRVTKKCEKKTWKNARG